MPSTAPILTCFCASPKALTSKKPKEKPKAKIKGRRQQKEKKSGTNKKAPTRTTELKIKGSPVGTPYAEQRSSKK